MMVAPEKGLASLITQRQAHASTPANNSQCIQYIFADPDLQACHDNGEINYKELSIAVQHKVQELAASQPSSSAGVSAPASQPGRLGPRDVTIDRASVCGSFRYSNDGYTLESLGNFSSCRANVACFKGKWQYECTVLTPGIQQIGWATIHCPFTAEEGVGDAPDSYAVDGKRVRKWSVKPQEYGEPWVQGDVIGCLLDLDSEPGTITFYRNGQSLGVAYSKVRTMQPSLAYFPAFSLSHTERCTVNFGARPFAHPVEGYQPLQAPPSQADRAAAEYYCGCLMRLSMLAAESTCNQVPAAACSKAAAADELPEGFSSTTAAAASPTSSAMAAAVAAAAAAGSAAGWMPPPPFAGSAALDSSDIVLLAAVLLQPLQEQLLDQPYLVQLALLPVLSELQKLGGDHQRALQLLVHLLALVWDENSNAFKSIVSGLLEELAYRCQVSPLLAQDYPYTAAYPHLSLAVALLQHPAVLGVLTAHSNFPGIVEGLLARKAPSPKDLQQLLPHVWWRGCRDETASQERMRASISIITTTMAKVEQRQYELLELLMAMPWSCARDRSSSQRDSSSSEDCALLVFLRFLLQKNRDALRDVPPPGLSEPTVLMSAFFVLLRMLQPALTAARDSGTGPLASFPAAQMFAGTGFAAETAAVFDAPRLGGVVSHLTREHPLSEQEWQPIRVHSSADMNSSMAATTELQQVNQQHVNQESMLPSQQQLQWPRQDDPLGSANLPGGGRVALQDAWVPELLNCCLLLYCWRVGFNYKMIQSLSSSVASSSSTLDELDRMIASYNAAGESVQALTWVSGTRKVYYDELVRDVRLLTLLRAAFFSPGKQAALCALSSYLSTLLANISSLSPLPAPAAGAAAGSTSGTDAAVVGSGSPEQPAVEDAAAAGQSNLLCYVPVVYVDVIVDYLTALRRCQEPSGTGQWVLQPQVTSSYVAGVCSLLNDHRIANPDVQESLLQVVGALLDHPAWRVMVESNTERTRQLLSSLLVVFDSRLWHPASSVLMKVVRSCGFGYPDSCPTSPNSLQQVLLDCVNAAAPSAATAEAPSTSSQASAAAAAHARGFLNRLFSTMNWCLTEFTVSVGDLHSLRGRRSILEAQNHYRRTGLMFELSVTFMRILEFVVPTPALLANAMNRTRLRELLQFVLLHFTNGPDARRLNELLQSSQPGSSSTTTTSGSGGPLAGSTTPSPSAAIAAAAAAAAGGGGGSSGGSGGGGGGGPRGGAGSEGQAPAAASAAISHIPAYAASAMRFESNSLSERVQKPVLLAPVMGILLALWDCHNAATAAADPGLPAAVAAKQAAPYGEVLLEELASIADERFMSALRFMQDVDWCAAFPSVPLSGPLRAFGQLVDALAAARLAQESATAGTALPDDIPDEFLDPITMEMMRQPVVLPDSQIVVDRSTIERHLLSSATDPFSRAPLTIDQVQTADVLQQRMAAWRQQQQQQ